MSALTKKLLRDLLHLRGQVIAITLVVACGVAVVVMARTAYESLLISQQTYYADYRFGDVFVTLKRAPEAVAQKLATIPGVGVVQTRIVFDVTLDVPGLAEPASGRLISLPERRHPLLNDVYIRRGRYLEPGRRDEILVGEAFAEANGLDVGDRIGAILNGRWEDLRIVGIVLCPEYVYEIRSGDIFPDNRRFGVIWMSRDAMGPAFNLDGAFNDVVLSLGPGAVEAEVIAAVDRVFERYGGLGAYGRHDQTSHRFLSDEIAQNRIFGTIVPAIFLGVAVFLLNIVLSRVVSLQRDQIAALKAFGYDDLTIGLHYLQFAMIAVLPGTVLGTGAGLWVASLINRMYVQFYRFPILRFEVGPSILILSAAAAGLAALLGAWRAARAALALPPAEAMRPEPPAGFRSGWLERSGVQRRLSTSARMIARNLTRRPGRAAMSVLGMAFAVAIVVVGRYFVDAIRYIADVQFRIVQRDDITVTFHDPLPLRARHDVAHLPGVLRTEPFRAVPVRLRHGHRSRRLALIGLQPGGELHRLVDRRLDTLPVPTDGVLLTTKLAEILQVRGGDVLSVEVLEGPRPKRSVAVAGVVDELVGLSAYMERTALNRLMRETGTISGVFLAVQGDATSGLYRELKSMPAIGGVALREVMLTSFEDTLARSMGIFTTVLVLFSCVIAVAMVYNAARIALSERGRELASLRVLGFTRREVGVMLLGEQAVLTLLSVPIGYLIGYQLCAFLAAQYQWELFRLPLVISDETYLFALAVVFGAALGSAWLVRRRLDRLDLVEVLKTRE